jgi:hypothetical protein
VTVPSRVRLGISDRDLLLAGFLHHGFLPDGGNAILSFETGVACPASRSRRIAATHVTTCGDALVPHAFQT